MSSSVEVISLGILGGVLLLAGYALTRVIDVRSITRPLNERFIYGVPWGTLFLVVLVAFVYVVLQGGRGDGGPIVVGFRSWSLWYGQGLVFSSFAHLNASHFIGNVVWLFVFGSIIEYAWGHHPPTNSSKAQHYPGFRVFTGYLLSPWVRVVVFAGGIITYGVLSSVVLPGATIGVSGIVFVLFGAAVVIAPRAAIAGIVAVEPLRIFVQAVLNPVVTGVSGVGMITPAWVDVSLQGHLFGFFVGLLVGVVFLGVRSGSTSDARFVAFAALGIAVFHSLYAFAWPVDQGQHVMFQAVGLAFVLVLVVIAVVASLRTNPILISQIDLSARETAIGALLCLVFAFSLVGIAYNVVPITGDVDGEYLEVEDYTVVYGEEMEDAYATAITSPVGIGGDTPTVSGVVVMSDDRNAWHVAVSKSELRSERQVTIPVGDALWREDIVVTRSEWSAPGQSPAYLITAEYDGEETRLYESDPVTSANTIDGHQVRIKPVDGEFVLTVSGAEGSVDEVAVPEPGESVELGDVTVERIDNRLFVKGDDTRVHIATYRGQ